MTTPCFQRNHYLTLLREFDGIAQQIDQDLLGILPGSPMTCTGSDGSVSQMSSSFFSNAFIASVSTVCSTVLAKFERRILDIEFPGLHFF